MRLITRSDFDGLVCATLLEAIGLVDEIFYTHPKDLQDGKVPVTANDVLANVPYVAGMRTVVRPPRQRSRTYGRGANQRRDPTGPQRRPL